MIYEYKQAFQIKEEISTAFTKGTYYKSKLISQ